MHRCHNVVVFSRMPMFNASEAAVAWLSWDYYQVQPYSVVSPQCAPQGEMQEIQVRQPIYPASTSTRHPDLRTLLPQSQCRTGPQHDC